MLRVHQGFDRVESRFRRTPREAPPTLVAPPEGMQTAVFAVQQPVLAARKQDTSGKPGAGSSPLMLHCTIPALVRAAGAAWQSAYNRLQPHEIGSELATHQEISGFLSGVERRAFKQAMFAVRDEDAALDIVQDAMLKLTEKYSEKPPEELPMLFQRILQNTIHDHFRRQKVRSTWTVLLSAFGEKGEKDEDYDPLETLPAKSDSNATVDPAVQVEQAQIVGIIEQALARLPARQREAFLLRYWEEMDVAETAAIMGCSEGSVKTHCSRAVHALSAMLRVKGVTL